MSWPSQSRWFDTLEMIAGALSSAAALLALTAFLHQQFSMIWLTILGGAALILGVTMGFIKLKKAWDLNDRRLSTFGQRMHSITHCVRDAYGQLQVWSTTPEFDEAGLFLHATATAKQCVNDLAEILSESSGQIIVATLQYFRMPGDGPSDAAVDLSAVRVDTLARSDNCKNLDARVDSVALSDNDAYREIVSDGRRQFRAPNLNVHCAAFQKAHGAPFSLGNLQHPHAYKSLVVLPIRVAEKFCKLKARRNKYIIIGFISLDSMSVDAFREDHIQAYCNIGMCCGDAMFHYLQLVDRLHEKLIQEYPDPGNRVAERGGREMEGEA